MFNMIKVSKCCKSELVYRWLTDRVFYSYCKKCKEFYKIEGEIIPVEHLRMQAGK